MAKTMNSSRLSFPAKVVIIGVSVSCCSAGIADLLGNPRVGFFQLFYFGYLALALLALLFVLSGGVRLRSEEIVWSVGVAYMAVLGLPNLTDQLGTLRNYTVDLLTLIAVLTGIFLIKRLSDLEGAKLFRFVLFGATGLLLTASVGLVSGQIDPGPRLGYAVNVDHSIGDRRRLVILSLYTLSWVIAVSAPAVNVYQKIISGARGISFPTYGIVQLGLASGIMFGVVSETRSVVLSHLYAILITYGKIRPLYVACVAVLFVSISSIWDVGDYVGRLDRPAVSTSVSAIDIFLDRVSASSTRGDDRFAEAAGLFSDLGVLSFVGTGAGSVFFSAGLFVEVNDLHLGLLNFIYKGGAVGLGAFVIWPLISMFRRRFMVRSQRAVGESLICMFFVQASMSGGWGFVPMLFFGMGLALLSSHSPQGGHARGLGGSA